MADPTNILQLHTKLMGGTMKPAKLMQWSVVLSLTLFWSNSLLADNCTGRWTNVSQSAETMDLGNGHTLTILFCQRQ